MVEKMYRGFAVPVNARSVLGYMGYPRRGNILSRPRVRESYDHVRHCALKYKHLIEPVALCEIFSCRCDGETLFLYEAGAALKSAYLARKFKNARTIALFVSTIGGRLEEETESLMKQGKMKEALVLDAIGSEAADNTAQYIHNSLAQELNSRLVRYSPGFHDPRSRIDWDISEQQVIFALLKPERIGVSLSADCMMRPRKSVSAIAGARAE